jgi:hypothetical protein
VARRAAAGAWVELHSIVLAPEERAPQVPEDTRGVPLELRVKGHLVEAAELGSEAEIVTVTGRRLRGTLDAIDPAYAHGFGAPIAELLAVGGEARAILATADDE